MKDGGGTGNDGSSSDWENELQQEKIALLEAKHEEDQEQVKKPWWKSWFK